MSIDQIIDVLVTITLIEMMVTIGLGVTSGEAIHVAENGRLVAQLMIADYVLIPTAAIGLSMLFHAHGRSRISHCYRLSRRSLWSTIHEPGEG